MTTPAMRKRPGVVTFVGIVIYIQAAIAAVIAVMAFVNRDDPHWQEQTGQGADALLGTAIGEAILALILVAVAMNLMSGSRGARTLVALVMGLRIAFATWAMLAHHGGGVFGTSAVTILVALFVLWALYGHTTSEEYFGDV
jgi:hypothetical protein